MNGNLWTAAEDRALKAKRANGMSASRIAKDLGKTRNAVIGRWHRLQQTYVEYEASCSLASRKATEARMLEHQRKEADAIRQLKRDIVAGVAPQTAIMKARQAGARWTAIGQTFGVTRQGAYYRGTCVRQGTRILA